MIQPPTFNTKDSDELCKEIARKSNGLALLGFSGGKDSVCAWLQLRRYFHTIIPFHCCLIPHMRLRDEALAYYERVFECDRILRMQDSALPMDLRRMVLQLPEDEEAIDAADFFDYDKHDIMDLIRKEYGLPKVWCAFGINLSDSLERRIYVTNMKGRNPNHKTFYPCYDWPHEKILSTVSESGVKLSAEYQFTNRSIQGMPQTEWMQALHDNCPDDYNRLKAYYPLMEAILARMEFRKRMNAARNAKAEAESGAEKAEGEGEKK